MKKPTLKGLLPIGIALFIAACNNGTDSKGKVGKDGAGNGESGSGATPTKIIGSSIIRTFLHDTSSFTQGLVFYNGALYEGTGEYGHSHLLKVDLPTGKIERQVSLDTTFFGEGITILHDTVYQLTWRENKVFSYSLKDFKKIKEFTIKTEGWGLTTDGKNLIVSDGSSDLYYYNPSFEFLRKSQVTEAGSLAFNLNELEFIDGYIYANQWQAPYILKIDPATGMVVGKIDLTHAWDRIRNIDPQADVPNGIAYDTASKKIYVTGKKWPELYELQLGK